jgi:hypothetical protein
VKPRPQRAGPGGPHLALIPGEASPEEAAAIVAALEQFVRDTAGPVPAAADGPDPWIAAALGEGVAREPGGLVHDPWINT